MKKATHLYILIFLLSFVFVRKVDAQTLKIPDANFKQALIAVGVDLDGDGEIQKAEAAKVTRLYVENASITSLEGIKSFTNLEEFGFYNNQIKVLDLEGMTSLGRIYGFQSQIEIVKVKGLTNLTVMYLHENKIRSLNLTGLKNLKELKLDKNMLSKIDISNLPNLEEVQLQGNKLTEFKADGSPALKSLNLNETWISTLDLSPFKKLEKVSIAENEFLTSLNIRGLKALKSLSCSSERSRLTNLNMSGTISLEEFDW